MYMGQFFDKCVYVSVWERPGDRETVGKIRESSIVDRQAGSPVYPQDDQITSPIPAVENQCWSRQEITLV